MVHLQNVFYSPEAGYTLISIGQLDNMGFSTTFGNGKCVIYDTNSAQVAKIPRNGRGLYKIVREGAEEVNAIEETLTLDALHCCLGHVLASKGLPRIQTTQS